MEEDKEISIKIRTVDGKSFIFKVETTIGSEIMVGEKAGHKWFTSIDDRDRRIWIRIENIASIDMNYGLDIDNNKAYFENK